MDDLSFAVRGKKFFPNGELRDMAALRSRWNRSPHFRDAVLQYAKAMGRGPDDIFMMRDDGKKEVPYVITKIDGEWKHIPKSQFLKKAAVK
jgi:hypothetical protein